MRSKTLALCWQAKKASIGGPLNWDAEEVAPRGRRQGFKMQKVKEAAGPNRSLALVSSSLVSPNLEDNKTHPGKRAAVFDARTGFRRGQECRVAPGCVARPLLSTPAATMPGRLTDTGHISDGRAARTAHRDHSIVSHHTDNDRPR